MQFSPPRCRRWEEVGNPERRGLPVGDRRRGACLLILSLVNRCTRFSHLSFVPITPALLCPPSLFPWMLHPKAPSGRRRAGFLQGCLVKTRHLKWWKKEGRLVRYYAEQGGRLQGGRRAEEGGRAGTLTAARDRPSSWSTDERRNCRLKWEFYVS